MKELFFIGEEEVEIGSEEAEEGRIIELVLVGKEDEENEDSLFIVFLISEEKTNVIKEFFRLEINE